MVFAYCMVTYILCAETSAYIRFSYILETPRYWWFYCQILGEITIRPSSMSKKICVKHCVIRCLGLFVDINITFLLDVADENVNTNVRRPKHNIISSKLQVWTVYLVGIKIPHKERRSSRSTCGPACHHTL